MEIEIHEPQENPNELRYRRYSLMDKETGEILAEELKEKGITPDKFPKAVDLAAGDGSLAAVLKRLGWKGKDITCIDQFESPTPISRDFNWEYVNLSNLASAVDLGDKLPPDIEKMRGKFDVVTMSLAFLGSEKAEEKVCEFFAKPKSFIFHL